MSGGGAPGREGEVGPGGSGIASFMAGRWEGCTGQRVVAGEGVTGTCGPWCLSVVSWGVGGIMGWSVPFAAPVEVSRRQAREVQGARAGGAPRELAAAISRPRASQCSTITRASAGLSVQKVEVNVWSLIKSNHVRHPLLAWGGVVG